MAATLGSPFSSTWGYPQGNIASLSPIWKKIPCSSQDWWRMGAATIPSQPTRAFPTPMAAAARRSAGTGSGLPIGRFGRAYKLYGLDSTNSQAFWRNIVLHSFSYVPEAETDPYLICNSLGCPMVEAGFLQQPEPLIKR
jgi:hypothetical protein